MSPTSGEKLVKSAISSLAGEGFGEFLQGLWGALKRKGTKKDPMGPVQGSTVLYCTVLYCTVLY